MVRLQSRQLTHLDAWIATHGADMSRPEAVRRILEQAIGSPAQNVRGKSPQTQKASDLAGRAADGLVDKSKPPEEQQRRKRALIKGPKEFRDIREDMPKSKT
jgi:hypothetical protein